MNYGLQSNHNHLVTGPARIISLILILESLHLSKQRSLNSALIHLNFIHHPGTPSLTITNLVTYLKVKVVYHTRKL